MRFLGILMRVTLAIFFICFCFVANGQIHEQKSVKSDTIKASTKNVRNADTIPAGQYFTINRIFITGNRITRDRIILRELSFKSGDVVYSRDLVKIFEADKRKLLNTRLFNTVEIKTMELEPLKVDVVVDVNERWYTFPSPLLELADRNFNEWWRTYDHDLKRINYGLRLYQHNMRGRNETLRLHAQFGFQRRFEIMYRIPYIDKTQKHGLSLDYNFSETKNLAYRTTDHKYDFLQHDNILRTYQYGGITYSYRKSFYQTHAVRLEQLSANIEDTVNVLNPLYLKSRTSLRYASISYFFNSDHRDLIAYPLRGNQFTASVTKTGLFAKDDVNKIEANITYSRYYDLSNGYYLSNNTVGYASYPKELPYLNFGVLGLRKQFVRGYELYVIEGPYFALNKTTFKKLIFSRTYRWNDMPLDQFRHIPIAIYLKTYADFGYVENYPIYEAANINTRLSNTLLSGGGLGVDIVGSYDMVLRFEYTFNAHGEKGFFFHIKREF